MFQQNSPTSTIKRSIVGVALAVTLIFGTINGVIFGTTVLRFPASTAIVSNGVKADALTPEAVYKKASPAVVNINVAGQRSEGTGAGFIISSDGQILTNYH